MTDLPALRLLLQGYLTLDWPEDYAGDPWAAVEDFAATEATASTLAGEVRTLLSTDPTEEAVRHLVVVELGSGYRPEADGLGYRDWLLEVAQVVEGRGLSGGED